MILASTAASDVRYRSAQPSDAEAIIAFLNACGYQFDERFWRWINLESPHGSALVELAWADDRVVGHYGVLPRPVRMAGVTVRAGLAIHAAVHPDFRGVAIIQALLDRMVDRCRQEQIRFLYGFPRRDVWLMYEKLFHWKLMGQLVALELPLDAIRMPAPRSPDAPAKIRVCDDAVMNAPRYRLLEEPAWLNRSHHVVKDAAFADWRYARHPRIRYPIVELCADGDTVSGFLVLKLYEKSGKRYGHVIDAALRPEALPHAPVLLDAALSWFAQRRVDVASCWMLPQSPLFRVLNGVGFQPTGFTTYVGCHSVDPAFATELLALDHWHMMMGDSDAF